MTLSRTTRSAVLALAITFAAAGAQVRAQSSEAEPLARTVVLVADLDDSNENGTADAAEPSNVDTNGAWRVPELAGDVLLRVVSGPVRVIAGGVPRAPGTALPADLVSRGVWLQGTRASSTADDALVEFGVGSGTRRFLVTVIELRWLDGSNRPLTPTRDALGLARVITNGPAFPRDTGFDAVSADLEDVRIEAAGPRLPSRTLRVRTSSGSTREVVLSSERDDRARSGALRWVGDSMDAAAPGTHGRVVRVSLRERVDVTLDGAEGQTSMFVGRPGHERGPRAARRGTLRVRVLRMRPDGPPVIGANDAAALRLARDQVAIANEIWLQCFATFGPPDTADVALVPPPPPALLAIGDGDGFRARGGGEIRFRAGTREVGPIRTRPDARPIATALAIAEALERAGFVARVTENARTEFGADRSADVVVRTRDGAPVALSALAGQALSTDAQQTVSIGAVDLSDGLREFDNMTARTGTLEERTLMKLIGDDDPSTIDIVIVNAFSEGTRQGEAFIEGDGGAVQNALILDRTGVHQQREAWTQSHELGHVLLNHPLHPDNVGEDRPWLLMDADNSLGFVHGPKRLGWDECLRADLESGPNATPALLVPWTEASAPELSAPSPRTRVRGPRTATPPR